MQERTWIESHNPATGEKLGEAPVFTLQEVQETVAATREAQATWGQLSVRRRLRALKPFRQLLVEQRDALAALIVVGLVIGGGFAIHRISWSQGYRMGQLAAGGEEGALAPYGLGRPGLLLTAGVILLVLLVIGKFFRFWAWKMVGAPWMMAHRPEGARWARHWHRPHGPMPPWCWGWEEPSEEKAEGVKPDMEPGAAEA